MPTITKIIPLDFYNRLRIIRRKGEMHIAKETRGCFGGWSYLNRIDITQEQAVGLAMALLEGTEYKITR